MTPGIGHNRGPGFGWRRYAWAKARRDLTPARVPLEIVRIRMRRAERLGLTYPQYAAILLSSGRDIVGFLFTVNGLEARLSRRLALERRVAEKLARLSPEQRLALSPADEEAADFREELEAAAGAGFAAVSPAPRDRAAWGEMRRAVRAALDPLKLPSDAVVMIGGGAEEDWAAAGGLARFLPSTAYFGPRP